MSEESTHSVSLPVWLEYLNQNKEARLRFRIETFLKYSTSYRDFPSWVLEHWALPPTGGAQFNSTRVLDVGCGKGTYLSLLWHQYNCRQLTGVDISPEIHKTINHIFQKENIKAKLLRGDILELALTPFSFDLILANHLLNHVVKIEQVLAKFARYLAPAGIVLLATDSRETLSEMVDLHEDALRKADFPREVIELVTRKEMPFCLENGQKQLAFFFREIEVDFFEEDFAFTDLEGFSRYYALEVMFRGTTGLHDPRISLEQWQQVWYFSEKKVREKIAQNGVYKVNRRMGLFRCQQAK